MSESDSDKTELRIQSDCFKWHWNTYPEERKRLFMVHNSPRNEIDGARMVACGMVAGVADLCYLMQNGVAVFIEMKKPKGVQSDVQKEWQLMVESFGFGYYICRSLDEFKELMEKLH